MNNQQSENNSNYNGPFIERPIFVAGFILGLILFLICYGFSALNPSYEGIVMMDRDITQHYMGWLYYRNSDWHFPIGLMDGISAPYQVSIVYSDSIPLFAVFFKLISGVLPETFQYFGIYGFVSFGLMGGFASNLINYFIKKPALSVALSTFFILSPYVLHRMFIHTALAGQWVIIFAMLLWIKHPYREEKPVRNMFCWTALLFVTSGIHLYLVAMVYVFCFLNSLEIVIRDKQWKWPIINLVASFVAVFFNLYILGAFYGGVSAGAGGFGEFSATLLTFFDAGNPDFSARILPNLPEGMYQFEGYGYLGFGMIMLCLFAFIIRMNKKVKFSDAATCILRFRLLIIACVVFGIWSIIPNITIGESINEPSVRTLLSIPMPGFLTNLFSILRCNGRFIWPVCYSIFLGVIVYLNYVFENQEKSFSRKFCTVGLVLALLVQVFDLSSGIIDKRTNQFFGEKYEPWYAVRGDVWDKLLETRPHVVYMQTDMERGTRLGYAIARKTIKVGGDINTFYLARDLNADVQVTIDEYKKELENKNARNDVIYIFPADTVIPESYGLHLYRVNEVVVGIAEDEDIIDMKYVEQY